VIHAVSRANGTGKREKKKAREQRKKCCGGDEGKESLDREYGRWTAWFRDYMNDARGRILLDEPPKPRDGGAQMSYAHETGWKGIMRRMIRSRTSSYHIGVRLSLAALNFEDVAQALSAGKVCHRLGGAWHAHSTLFVMDNVTAAYRLLEVPRIS
jgi:hypothetical protein